MAINDYSQHGEGKIISDFFKGYQGELISLGENDGKTLSNVLGLIEDSWYAKLVEPSKTAFKKLSDLHEDNTYVNCYNFAIGETDGTLDFFESGTHLNTGDTSLLSSLKECETKRWLKESFNKTQVPVKTWATFIKEAKVKTFDLISIDCEGMDFEILSQIDLNKHRTQMVVVESNSVDDKKFIHIMYDQGFRLHYKNFCNLIFTK